MSDEKMEQVEDAIHDMAEQLCGCLVAIDCNLRDEDDRSVFRDKNGFSLLASLPAIASGLQAVANAVTPLGAAPGQDAGGGYVGSLTEAVMGVSGGLFAIAGAIERLADAIRPQDGNQ